MRPILAGFLLLANIAAAAPVALPAISLPSGSEARQARLLAALGPQARGWIKQEAKSEAAQGSASPDTARSAAQLYGKAFVGGFASADVNALVFLVLMQVAQASDQDLKDILAGVQSTGKAKQAQQGAMAQMVALAADRRNRMIAMVADALKNAPASGGGLAKSLK